MATTGDLRPTQFLWPTLWLYTVAAGLKAGLVVLGPLGEAGPFGHPALNNMTYVYGMARAMTALAGALTVLGVYAVTTRWLRLLRVPTPTVYGIAAAGFLALGPVHIQHSKLMSTDVPMTALVVLCAWLTLRLFEDGRTRSYVAAGVALGLAGAAKYPGVLYAFTIVVAHLARSGGSWRRPQAFVVALFDWRLWLAGLVTIAAFCLISPFILIDWHHFQDDFWPQMNRVMQAGAVSGIGLTGPYAPVLYAPLVIGWGIDVPGAILAGLGLAAALWLMVRSARHDPTVAWAVAVMLVFPLVQIAFSWTWSLRFARYLMPLVPFACVLAGYGLAVLTGWLAGALHRPAARVPLAAGIGFLVLLWQADGVVRYDALLTRPDTRTITARWMESNLAPGEQVMVEWYGPPYGNVRQMGFDLSDRPVDRYLGRTPRFVAVSSFTYDRWLRDPERSPRRVAFYQALDEQATLLYAIEPWPVLPYDPVQEGWSGWHGIPLHPEARPGPVLRVYQLP
jgi:Dolichyl-phosphate-mannose-protein mannosyltransferase